ncbi:abortive infection family protein [Lysobacter sp. K5869]|uniref:abortive infection family protein n=1 Tax=Lysobacter sp. K5869 TaxID=2820808 RepID=UPI001C06240F|nr:abortive infection family protein [Lysobacter sp. K5869]QWP78320.1 abortive infection family protein [Lysobacter sp. K5869]
MKISQLTRRDIIDAMIAEQVNLYGRLEETEFLSRLFDLQSLPSFDPRFKDAAGDIWQHRVNNYDWNDDWVFYDTRLNILNGDDEIFLRFLAEVLHPVVRSDSTEAERICQMFNQYLRNDGFQLVERTRLSGKPVYIGRYVGISATPGINAARESLAGTDPSYVSQQITRIEAAIINDPSLAIGTAKELVETCCKTILSDRNVVFSRTADIPELVKLTAKELELTPDDIPDKAKAAETIKRLLSNLASITQGVAELRNHYGTGHGKVASTKGLKPRHAKLAAGAASTLAVFLTETHNDRPNKP